MRTIFLYFFTAGILLILSTALQAQFSVGHTTITFNDPNRTGGFGSGGGPGRQIQTEIYYPAASNGDNVPVSDGEFPVVVIGHGFVMSWDAYANIWGLLVPQGYVVALPRTEGGFSPNHGDFGLDLSQVLDNTLGLGNNNQSIFFGKIASTGAIMGHSMGGGASFLAGAQSASATTIIGLAPAETTGQSAIAAAANIAVPVLVFSGSEDAVTPPAEHHLPIYNAAASECKFYLSIVGGGHCYFANSNANCDFGELVSGLPSMNRATQQGLMNQFLLPWLDWHLKDNQEAALEFQIYLESVLLIDYQTECVVLSVVNENAFELNLYPNPASDHLIFEFQTGESLINARIQIFSVDGKLLKNIEIREINTGFVLPVEDLSTGVYHLNVISEKGSYTKRFFKQ